VVTTAHPDSVDPRLRACAWLGEALTGNGFAMEAGDLASRIFAYRYLPH